MTARNYDADEECCCGASITLRGYYLSTQVQNELAAWRKNHRHEAPEPRSGTGSVKIEPRQRGGGVTVNGEKVLVDANDLTAVLDWIRDYDNWPRTKAAADALRAALTGDSSSAEPAEPIAAVLGVESP